MLRLSSLDYLRGLSALGIVLFHYSLWTVGIESSSNIFTRIGIYGVSIFYILSGLTLYHVYTKTLNFTRSGLKLFYLKRGLRIYPLLWLATVLAIIISPQFPEKGIIFTNLTGLFGFYKWYDTIAYGAWSIGNELVFYLLFPGFLYISRRSKRLFNVAVLLAFLAYAVFAFLIFDKSQPFVEQWNIITNPLNHLFLFISGMWLGFTFKNRNLPQALLLVILFLSVSIFVFYPVAGERMQLLLGLNRMVFTISCIAICLVFYKLRFNFPGILNSSLIKLGHCSYSLYLLHPIFYKVADKVASVWGTYFFVVPQPLVLVLTGFSTLIISYIIYYYFESYFTQRDRQLSIYEWLQKTRFQNKKMMHKKEI